MFWDRQLFFSDQNVRINIDVKDFEKTVIYGFHVRRVGSRLKR
jgi:hypothetical protein